MLWSTVADTVGVHGVGESSTPGPAGLQQRAQTIPAAAHTDVASVSLHTELVRETVTSGVTCRGVANNCQH